MEILYFIYVLTVHSTGKTSPLEMHGLKCKHTIRDVKIYRVSQKTRKLLKSLIVKIECPTKKLNVMMVKY